MAEIPGLPGGPLATRPLYFIFITDCSGSMAGEKIQSLNSAIREALPHMRDVAKSNPNARVLVRALKFSAGAQWHISQATDVETFQWVDLHAGGQTDMGRALLMLADAMKMPPMAERALPPVLVLVSDGQPTDDFSGGLKALMDQPWGKKAVRIAIAIGDDADLDVLQRFIGHAELKPLVAHNAPDLVKYIRWASTAVLQSASAPASQSAQTSLNVPIPPPPAPSTSSQSAGDPNDVW
jgi:uncharacterized protein YegL